MFVAALLTLALLVARPASAQVATGFPPYGSYGGGSFDTVNNANLNVHFAIPIINKAGRGLPFSYAVSYDSSIWSPVSSTGAYTWTPVGQTVSTASTWGWQGTSEALTGYVTYWVSQQQCVYDARPYYYNVYSSWVYNDGQGTVHSIPGLSVSNGNSTPCVTQYPSYSGIGSSTDGSGFQIQVDAGPDATVYSVSGVAITPPLQTPNPTSGTYKITDPNGNVISSTVFTHFDMLGRVYTVSNPYCTTNDPTYGFTSYFYDALNRTTSVTYPDTAATTISYTPTTSGNCSTTTDPAGKARTLCSDALGRITSVTENPSSLDYLTAYTYDDLNDLTQVAQGSSQTRSYGYDMLGRLSSAQTPEAGTTTYSYAVSGSPCSGNPTAPCSRTDARSVTTTYAYDALNRPTSKSYNDTPQTPSASFFYDQAPSTMPSWTGVSFSNPKGRLVLSCTNTTLGTCTSPSTATAYSYDPMGRTANFWQCNPSNCGTSTIWNTQYTYDLAGDIQNWVHPDKTYPATFTNTVNNAQQITNVATQWTDGYHPSSLATISYSPWGAINSLTNGCASSGCTNTVETYTYNNRLQPWMIQLGTSTNSSSDYCLVYNYFSSWTAPSSCPAASSVPTSGTGNNGNATGYWYQDSVNTSFDHTMSYTYDNVNRLTEAMATGNSSFTQTYGYTGDGSTGQYGNMTCKTGCANMPANVTFSASTNQITSPNYTYDAAGDLTKDSSNSTAHTYQWDAEGRVSKVDSGTTWTFTYNAMGDRVAWVSGGVTSDHLFDPSGTWLGVAGSYSFVMLGIRPLAVYNTSDTWFHHVNNIGSRTMMTAHYGNATQDMVFYPFGGLWLNWGGGGLEFADLTYDDPNSNSQLTTYRLFSGNLGRWHSPDPLGGDVTNPQSLNRYGYVLNNPTGLIDPLGLDPGQGSDPGECDCNDPNCVNAACWGPGWPPGFWPPNGGEGSGGSGGGGPAIHLPTGNTGGPGMPNGFLEPGTGVIDLDVTFGITTWGWPLVVACATDPVCAVPAATVAVAGAGYLVYKGIQAGVQVYQSSAKARDIRQIARAYCIDPNVLGAAVHADKKGGPSEPGYDLSKQGIIDIAKRLSEDPRNRIPGCVPHPF